MSENDSRSDLRNLAFRAAAFVAAGRRARSPHVQRLALIVAALTFVGAFAIGIATLPGVEHTPRWWLLALVPVVGVPVTVLFSALEYRLNAEIVGHRVSLLPALRVSVFASAANLLPVPGSVLVRAAAMHGLGARARGIAVSTAVVGLAFPATAAVIAGGALLAAGEVLFGGCVLIAGAVLLLSSQLLCTLELGRRQSALLMVRLVLVETGSVLIKAARLYVVILALGYESGIFEALGLTMAAVTATAVGFLPSGLGLAELLGAVIAPLVGLPASVGVTALGVDRLLGLAGLAVLAGVVALAGRFEARREAGKGRRRAFSTDGPR